MVLDLAQGFFPGFSPFPLSIKIDQSIRGTQALKSKQCYKLSSKKKISSFTLNTYSADNICIRFTLFLLFGSTHTGIRTRCTGPQKRFYNNNNNNETADHRVKDPVNTSPDKILNERIFYLCNPFTRNRANSVTDCNTVCRSKTSTFPRVPCKRKARDPCRYLSVQKNCPAPCKRGFTLRYIEPVVVSIYKLLICIEMLPHEGNLIIRNSICQCRTFIWPSGRSTEF